jgi:AcrR family transcriptional regulator
MHPNSSYLLAIVNNRSKNYVVRSVKKFLRHDDDRPPMNTDLEEGQMSGELARTSDPAVKSSISTIQKILAAAEDEFGAKGFDGTKMEHIAQRAGISKQLIYHYFGSKKELYGEMLTLMARQTQEMLLQIDYETLDPKEALQTYIASFFDHCSNRPACAAITMDQSLHSGSHMSWHWESKRMHDTLVRRLSTVLETGKAANVFSADATVESFEFMTTIIVSGCVSSRAMFSKIVGHEPCVEGGPGFWREYAISFIMRSLRPPGGN